MALKHNLLIERIAAGSCAVRLVFREEQLESVELPETPPPKWNSADLAELQRMLNSLERKFARTASSFAQRVRDELRKIPRGSTATYGEIARRLGAPGAARAVGAACAANRLLLVVPCHRVVPGSGGVGEFRLGQAWKEKLLALERSSL